MAAAGGFKENIMSSSGSETEKQTDSKQAVAALSENIPKEDLDQAIEELHGVLDNEDAATSDSLASVFSHQGQGDGAVNNDIIMNIPVDVQIVLGSTEMPVVDLMALQKGSTVALNRRIGEPVDVVVNGRKIATGEITVLEDDPSRFGIKLIKIIDAAKSG